MEIKYCIGNLFSEISSKNPKIVFLLGEKVYSSIEKYLGLQFDKLEGYNFTYYEYKGIYFIPIQHPSYIWIYKRKEINNYINNILSVINILLKSYK